MKVVISSKNPVKVNATLAGFKSIFPDKTIEHEAVSVSSGVSEQPLSDEETYQGALTRATNAKKEIPTADFWVGIEGGLEKEARGMAAFAWAVIINKEGVVGKSRTSTFFVPQVIIDHINQGKELGDANDIVFKDHNTKQKQGMVGSLTNGTLERTQYYEQAVLLALIPFIHPDLY